MTEHEARTMLWHAANYLHANQLGDSTRVKAMDLLDDIRRDIANWQVRRDEMTEHALTSLAVWSEYGRATKGNPSEFVWLWANYVRHSGYSTEQNRLAALNAFMKGGANGSL